MTQWVGVTLEEYEEQLLKRMYDEEIISGHYKPIERVRSKVNWLQLVEKYRVKKSFTNVIRRLYHKGYVDFSGKSGTVCSLSQLGAAYVRGRFG
jgi:hypothetical protein